MDQLEKRIRDLRDEIQNDLPEEGHFERFEQRLQESSEKHASRWIAPVLAVAAVLLIAFLFLIKPEPKNERLCLAEIAPEYAEAENFYRNAIDRQTNMLVKYSEKTGNNTSLQMLLSEMENYDKTYDQLCTDLNTTPNDSRVINAMITYYQTKLEIINKILYELESKQKNEKQDENIEI